MARKGYRGVTLKDGWVDALDEWRSQFRYKPTRAEAVYEALVLLFEEEGYDPRTHLDPEDIQKYYEEE